LIQLIRKFENGVCDWVAKDQSQTCVVVKFWNSKKSKKWQSEIVPHNKKSQLWMNLVIDQRWFWPGGLYKKSSPWCALGWHAKSWESLVWKTWNREAQSRDQNINGRFDHYHMWSPIEFEKHLNCVSWIPIVVINV
jgi:hypothetical protein